MKDSVRKILSLVLIAVFLVSTSMFAIQFFDKQAGSATYDEAQQLANLAATESTVVTPVTEATEPPETTEPTGPTQSMWTPAPVTDDPHMEELAGTDLDALRQENEDVVGWIYIPDTKIHYPIVQGEDNEHYLTHTWNNKRNYVGAIFMETLNNPNLVNFNTIIYGHNMRDGSMFAALQNYYTTEYWENHPYVYLVTDAGVLRYEIFSAYDADVESQTYALSFRQRSTRESFIQMAVENSDFDTGIIPEHTDLILTLSTCTGLGYSQRRVMHARLPMVQVQ